MTKAEIIKEVSERTGIEKPKVEIIIDAYIATIQKHVVQKESIYSRGFGVFTVKRRAAKIARNISKNTAFLLPAHYIPAFKPSKRFLDKVKNSKNISSL